MTFGTWRWWGCQPDAPAPLPPGMFLVHIFTRGWVEPRAVVRSEGKMSLKNPATPLGIDPGTVRLIAQPLNHYATPGPQLWISNKKFDCVTKTPVFLSSSLLNWHLLKPRAPLPAKSSFFIKVVLFREYKIKFTSHSSEQSLHRSIYFRENTRNSFLERLLQRS